MIALPIPLITAAVLAYLGIHAALKRTTPPLVLLLIAICVFQSVLISLNQYYGFHSLAPLQPVSGTLIPILLYLAFQTTTSRELRLIPDAFHLIPVLAVGAAYWIAPNWVDGNLILTFCGYAAAIFGRTLKGPEGLPLDRFENDNRALKLWKLVALALFASGLSDLAVTAVMILDQAWLKPWIISFYSALFLLALGAFGLSDLVRAPTDPDDEATSPKPTDVRTVSTDQNSIQTSSFQEVPENNSLLQELQKAMFKDRLFLDPNLTLRKLARRLGTPEKQVSSAVNQAYGMNLPRYINQFRIDHACELLDRGKTVTATIYESGFNTKSNFNREFLRLKGVTPSDYSARR